MKKIPLQSKKHYCLIGKFKYFVELLSDSFGKQQAEKMLFILFEDLLSIKKTDIFIGDTSLDTQQEKKLVAAVNLLLQNKPIQYITAKAHFYDQVFYVNEDVLIPRPETEEIVKLIIDENCEEKPRILDIGTGSGCIAVSLKHHLPQAEVVAADTSAAALKIAEKNAGGMMIQFMEIDILSEQSRENIKGVFDIIVSNPPYIPLSDKSTLAENITNYEPHAALFVPDNAPLLFYQAISDFSKKHLKQGGKLYFEINEVMGEEIQTLLTVNDFREIQIIKDMNGKDRFAKALKNLFDN